MSYAEPEEEWGGIPSHDSDSTDPPESVPSSVVAFDLGRLPLELRAKVISMAAAGEQEDDWDLLFVSKEFHQVVAPIRYEELELVCEELRPYSLGMFAMTVLPRYGSMIRRINLVSVGKATWEHKDDDDDYRGPVGRGARDDSGDDDGDDDSDDHDGEDGDYEEEAFHHGYDSTLSAPHETEILAANIVANLPNLASLAMELVGLPRIIATSPHLASLRSLQLSGAVYEDRTGAAGIISLITRSPNLEFISLEVYSMESTEYPLLITALASRRRLAILSLQCADALNDDLEDVDWECPLKTLDIRVAYYVPGFMSLVNFRKFISNFSTTLESLILNAPIDEWAQPVTIHLPLSLPHLTTLFLNDTSEAEPLEPSDPYQLLRLFDESPITYSGTTCRPGHPANSRSLGDTLRLFIQRHETTLKTMSVRNPFPSLSESESRDLEAYALGLGIGFALF